MGRVDILPPTIYWPCRMRYVKGLDAIQSYTTSNEDLYSSISVTPSMPRVNRLKDVIHDQNQYLNPYHFRIPDVAIKRRLRGCRGAGRCPYWPEGGGGPTARLGFLPIITPLLRMKPSSPSRKLRSDGGDPTKAGPRAGLVGASGIGSGVVNTPALLEPTGRAA